ncbi:MAG: nucleoside triphosphate pyrophosphohydrolase [Proteobacteria bacterium]|nr:nucleoside triphosphate pyrophosphohydrolase [Pseudomonadota bacterium]
MERPIDRLLEIMTRLRDPERGCPWDREQRFETIAPYTIEEAYEVDDAIRRGDERALRDELGDLLFQVVYHAQMARELGHFDFDAVADAICEKLVRRHPHVFGEAQSGGTPANWEAIKARERSDAAARRGRVGSALDDVPKSLPALARAAKLQRRAQAVGETEPDPGTRVRALLDSWDGEPASAQIAGELLFATTALAQQRGLDAETALRDANAAFEARVRERERRAGES